MKVLLVTPENRFIRAFRRGQLNNFAQLTMAHLAGFVRPPHTVALVDEYVQSVDLEAPADLVGITCSTPNASHVYGLADAFRARGRTYRTAYVNMGHNDLGDKGRTLSSTFTIATQDQLIRQLLYWVAGYEPPRRCPGRPTSGA